MNGEPPRDPFSAGAEGQGLVQGPAEEDEDWPSSSQAEPRIPYMREHATSPTPPRRKATLTGTSSPPAPSTPSPDQALAYSAIPGPAPLPRVPGMDRLVGDDGASRSNATTGRHRSRRVLRAPEDRPSSGRSSPPGAPSNPPAPLAPSAPSVPPTPVLADAAVEEAHPVSLSAPAPEVRDDDWGGPDSTANAGSAASKASAASATTETSATGATSAASATSATSATSAASAATATSAEPMHSREALTEPAPGPVDSTSAPSQDAPPPSPLALRTIPRPGPRSINAPPPVQAVAGFVDPDSVAVIQPARIIDVLSDLPAVPSSGPDVSVGEVDEELPLGLLADGPTSTEAPAYLGDVEPRGATDGTPEVSAKARASIEDPETLPLEEVEPEPRSEVEPASIEEVEPDREGSDEIEAVPVTDRGVPDSAEEIEPDRESDSSEEIPIDMVDEQPVRSGPQRPPPPPKRPPAMASVDLAPFAASIPPTSTPTPGQVVQVPPLAAPPPPLKQPTRPGTEPAAAPTEDTPRRKKPWWEELFSEDYIRTMDRLEPKMVRREVDFIEERLGMEKGAVILDLACGPGLHAVEMASRGYSLVGYDLSLAMLAHASDEAQERGQKLNFLQGDMREMAFEETFDAVYCWSTSFGYFEEEKNVDVLVRIRRALRSGGLLLLDVVNRDYVASRQPSLVWFEGEGCVCMDEMAVDFFTSRLKVKRTVMFEDGRSRELDYSIRLYGLHELGKILHEAGFKVIEVTGHPAHPGVFFGSESPRLIVLAERA